MENSKNGKRGEIYQSHGLFGLQNLKTPLIFQTPKLRKVAHDRRLRLAWHVSCGWRRATVGTLHPRRRGVNLGKRQETGQISSNMVEPANTSSVWILPLQGTNITNIISPTSKGTFWVDDSSLSRCGMLVFWRVFLWSFTPHSSKNTKLFDFSAWKNMKKSSKVNNMKSTKYDNWIASAITRRKPPNIKLRGKNIAINGPSKYIKCLPFGRFLRVKQAQTYTSLQDVVCLAWWFLTFLRIRFLWDCIILFHHHLSLI